MGWAGQALVVENQTSLREAIQRQGDYVSIVRSVATIDDAVYAVGMKRQVYKRIGSGRWEAIDRGVVYHGDETAIGFNAIDGFDSDDIYAVGLNGEIWHRREDEWREVHSPTNVHLHSTCCAPSGQVYVGGRSGVFMRGRDDTWDCFDLDTEETIWDFCWFKHRLYMIVGKAIYKWTSESIEKIENDVVANEDFHSFALTSSELLIFGRKKIIKHDGFLWDELNYELPDDIGNRDILGFFNDDVLSVGSAYLEGDE